MNNLFQIDYLLLILIFFKDKSLSSKRVKLSFNITFESKYQCDKLYNQIVFAYKLKSV